ncbi:zinc dependent phospholipase C family protein [Lentibacillus sp.]|uniref:zinc dependent phospholipase C family protein n=1 Tax=Lentibacillus sp. TaxID=1925746 RepID=UPI002B4B221F|nr:zinc dependent phospholipase C family protein [Lentibacillus sp.]HLS10091.1 zinc dependent phospholipase C family protein [Lentibacillus sp.]
MPNIWTHILFCENVLDSIENPNLFLHNDAYMKLGAQGPDPLFYYNFWPWIKNEPVNDIGLKLHREKCGEFLMDIIDRGKDMDDRTQAYIFGFVTHHILDRNAHPYIHYRAGYEGNNHQKLEVLIDTLMMEKYYHLKTWKAHVYTEIDVGTKLDARIINLLHAAITAHYPEISPRSNDYLQKAYRDMKLALKLLADPYGWKNVLLKPLISPYSHQPIKQDADYLNLEHTTWYHPATNEPCTKSFIDLYNQAWTEGVDIMSDVIAYWNTGDNIIKKRLGELIGNISYDTGKPLALNLVNHYSEPIV